MNTARSTTVSRARSTCPHCGNRDPRFLLGDGRRHDREDNGERPSHYDYTVLCVAPVPAAEWSFGADESPYPDQIAADGTVPCGMQWDPNAS